MWIGIECGVEAHELEKWACEIERIGGGGGKDGQSTSGGRVGEFLRRCARLIDGTGVDKRCVDGVNIRVVFEMR